MKIFDAKTKKELASPDLENGYLLEGTCVVGRTEERTEIMPGTITKENPDGLMEVIPPQDILEPCMYYYRYEDYPLTSAVNAMAAVPDEYSLSENIHEVKLSGYNAEGDTAKLSFGTWGSYGIEKLQVYADASWTGLEITATFVTSKASVRVVVPEDGLFDVPPEATANSVTDGKIVFCGVMDGVQRITKDVLYTVDDHAKVEGTAPEPTPSEYEQFVKAVKESAEAAKAAAETAEYSVQAAENAAENARDSAQQAADKVEELSKNVFSSFFGGVIKPSGTGDIDLSRPMTTPSAQESWTIESRGDRIQSVQVNGFTSDGESAGLGLVEIVLDGSPDESWEKDAHDTRFYIRQDNLVRLSSYIGSLFCDSLPTAKNHGSTVNQKSITGYPYAEGIYPGENWIYLLGFNLSSVEELRAELAKSPLIVHYVPTDESQATGLYIPIQAKGHEYHCQCLPITEALGVGDNVQSNVPSGCDQSITLDGSAVTVTASGSTYVSAAANAAAGGVVYANGLSGLSLLANQASIPAASFPGTVTNAETANSWLQSNPQTIYYQSTAYTEQNDIFVSLETHASGNVYAHPAVELVAVPYTDADSGKTAKTYEVSSQSGTTVLVSLKAAQDGGDAATLCGASLDDIKKLISDAVIAAVQMAKA